MDVILGRLGVIGFIISIGCIVFFLIKKRKIKIPLIILIISMVLIGLSYSLFNNSRDTSYESKKENKTSQSNNKPKEQTNQAVNKTEKRNLAFESNGYSDYNGNWRKNVDDEGMYMLFFIGTTAKNSYFTIADGTGVNSATYFYGSGYGGHNNCSYNYENDTPMDGATCNEDETSNAKAVKNIFDNELKTLGLTIDDLN